MVETITGSPKSFLRSSLALCALTKRTYLLFPRDGEEDDAASSSPPTVKNPFWEVWRARSSATSIVAAGANHARRSFRLTPSGRFATFGGKCPLGTRFPPFPSKVNSYRPALPGGRGVCAPRRKHFLSFWRKRPAQPDFFDTPEGG